MGCNGATTKRASFAFEATITKPDNAPYFMNINHNTGATSDGTMTSKNIHGDREFVVKLQPPLGKRCLDVLRREAVVPVLHSRADIWAPCRADLAAKQRCQSPDSTRWHGIEGLLHCAVGGSTGSSLHRQSCA